MFIITTDYLTQITKEELEILAEKTNTATWNQILTDVNKAATDIISGYIGQYYDVVPEFNKTGYDRNYQLLTWGIFIALYLIYQRVGDSEVPEKIIKNYDDTIEDLKDISKGKAKLNLPVKTVETPEGTEKVTIRRSGSKPQRSHTM